MKEIAVIKNYELNVFSEIEKKFEQNGFILKNNITDKTDLVLSLGGDGTILRSVQLIKNQDIPILGFNLGRLGFLTSEFKGNLDSLISQIQHKEYRLKQRSILNIVAYNKNKTIFDNIALNEVVIRSEHIHRLTELEVELDDILISKYVADGIIIATPTGSTAYSLSSGGPILEPEMEALILTPICPHSLNQRPLIFDNKKIAKIKTLRKDKLFVSIDGQINNTVPNTTKIEVKQANYKIKILRFPNENFYEILHEKLSWGNK